MEIQLPEEHPGEGSKGRSSEDTAAMAWTMRGQSLEVFLLQTTRVRIRLEERHRHLQLFLAPVHEKTCTVNQQVVVQLNAFGPELPPRAQRASDMR